MSYRAWGIVLALSGVAGCHSVMMRPPGRLDVGNSPDAQLTAARLQEREGNFAQAQQLYQALLDQNPRDAELQRRLGVLAVKQGRLEAGIGHLQQARSLNPTLPHLQSDLGYTLFLQGRLDEAAEVLQRAVTAAPHDKRAMNNLAMVLAQQGKTSQSEELFEQANGAAQAHANLAFLHAQRGELEQAAERYSRALDHDSELRIAAEGLVELAEFQQRNPRTASAAGESSRVAAAVTDQPAARMPLQTLPGRSPSRLSGAELSAVVEELREKLREDEERQFASEELAQARSSRRVRAADASREPQPPKELGMSALQPLGARPVPAGYADRPAAPIGSAIPPALENITPSREPRVGPRR